MMSFQTIRLHHRHAKAWPYFLYPSPSGHNTNSVLSLHRIFNITIGWLEGQYRFWAGKLIRGSDNPSLHHFLAWCRHWSITSSRSFSTNVSWSSSTFWALPSINRIHDEKCPPCPRWFLLSSTTPLTSFQVQACPCYGCNLLSSLYYVLPWSITVFYVKNVVRIAPPLINSWYSDTSRHHRSSWSPCWF